VLAAATPRRLERNGPTVTAVEVEHEGRTTRLPCETLVSSIPMQALAGLLFPGDEDVAGEVRGLRLRDLALVFLFLRQERLVDDHWIFFPERQYLFNRLFEQKSMDPGMGPSGRTAVCCDLTCDEGDPVWSAPDGELVRRCFSSLVEAGLTTEDRLEAGEVRRFKSFYPMYTVDYRERLRGVYDRLKAADNLVLTGRVGMFNYNNSDHCLDMGRFIASEMAEGRKPREVWAGLEERVRTYRIID
jgi:protoporphyrinogen oxidase